MFMQTVQVNFGMFHMTAEIKIINRLISIDTIFMQTLDVYHGNIYDIKKNH